MKRRIVLLIVSLLLTVGMTGVFALSSLGADGDTVYSEGPLHYTVKNESITIIGCFGKNAEVEVPAMIAGIPVNTIATGAFTSNAYIQTLRLPDTISKIESGAIASRIKVIYNANTDHPQETPTQLILDYSDLDTTAPDTQDTAAPPDDTTVPSDTTAHDPVTTPPVTTYEIPDTVPADTDPVDTGSADTHPGGTTPEPGTDTTAPVTGAQIVEVDVDDDPPESTTGPAVTEPGPGQKDPSPGTQGGTSSGTQGSTTSPDSVPYAIGEVDDDPPESDDPSSGDGETDPVEPSSDETTVPAPDDTTDGTTDPDTQESSAPGTKDNNGPGAWVWAVPAAVVACGAVAVPVIVKSGKKKKSR